MTTSRVAGPQVSFPEQATLADLLEAQSTATPDAVALIGDDGQLTYGELHDRAERLAHRLRHHGVGPDVVVAVFLDRSVALAVGLLAVQLAGGACLALDPSYPATRLALVLDDATPPVLLTRQGQAQGLPAYGGHVVLVDADGTADDGPAHAAPARTTGAQHLAYVIYTSGSTGAPKGVMLTHRGLVNHSVAVSRLYELAPGDRVLQFCSIAFDASIEEIFPTWTSGASLALRPDDLPVLGRPWLEWLRRMKITVLNLPTAYWHEWVRDLEALGERVPDCVRLVIVGGEKALGSAYRSWLELGGRRVRWCNAYGPAEATVVATIYEPPGSPPLVGDPPIGMPIANATARILDERGGDVPVGDVGDLHIGGVGIARGYLNRPDLTAERFVPDPENPGALLYRTGDLVRLLDDGNLEFAGRADEQVKIRGFRIECHEIERTLDQHPAVAEATVVAREDEPGRRRLVAYVVTADDVEAAPVRLRRFLAERLPPYMVPSAFVRVSGLPLTPNGKVDRAALPPPGDPRDELTGDRIAPRTTAEQTIAEVWSRILGIDVIGVDDDFFELGGHSLQAAQVVADVRQAFGAEIGVRALFEAPTIARLAALVAPLRGHDHDHRPPLVAQRRDAAMRIPLTLSQQQMWQLETSADPPGLFNVTAQHRFAGGVDEATLRQALEHLASRHETMRTSFHTDAGGPYQRVEHQARVDLESCDLTGVALGQLDEELHRQVGEQDAAPFDLARAPLSRSRSYRFADGSAMVAVTFDHLVCDGTSAYIFLSELVAAYEALAAGSKPTLRSLPVQYADFALWQLSWLGEDLLEAQLEYWKRTL
ncbi:MAG: amino acid adenylation domain-containing protein, partial [Acidimicrobiia bacterium]|nr:amino acid adenylation domain-containing protein [Acidimicrobiia bacterium]